MTAKPTIATTLLACLCSPGLARPVEAFGNDGHRIVCGIAYLLLDETERKEITTLTASYRRPDGEVYKFFTEACTFPDLARDRAKHKVKGWTFFSRFNNWHFMNVPRDIRTVAAAHCGDDCVLNGIDFHARRLGDQSLEPFRRAEAMFFLAHWIGDIHQPLHVSFRDDLGGNEVFLAPTAFYTNEHLHSVWDSGIISKAKGPTISWWTYATRLKDTIAPALQKQWLDDSPLEWAQQSYSIAVSNAVDYCAWEKGEDGESCSPEGHPRNLTADYQEAFQDVLELRLEQAGVRLADRIRRGLRAVK